MEAPFSWSGCRGGIVDGGERTLSRQEHPTRGCTVHRVRQLELEARRGATTNFFSDNNRGVFSNSTTTIPTRPSSAAYSHHPTTRASNSTWDLTQNLLLVEVLYLTRNDAHRVD
mmetsp:Transcript_37713/g.38182  ORF Transcript_37713/g.38182 Transcript_37713/m.38182 type:complete len:114 (+) Transcript_37713:1038-1379(+)